MCLRFNRKPFGRILSPNCAMIGPASSARPNQSGAPAPQFKGAAAACSSAPAGLGDARQSRLGRRSEALETNRFGWYVPGPSPQTPLPRGEGLTVCVAAREACGWDAVLHQVAAGDEVEDREQPLRSSHGERSDLAQIVGFGICGVVEIPSLL